MLVVTKSFLTVSVFDDEELSVKLVAHKTYEEHPTVEDGIRYARFELPSNKKSLPY